MQWWDNIWLNEGFATWMETKCVAAMHPEWNIPQYVVTDQERTLNYDAQPTTRAIRARADTPEEIDQMFDLIAYNKAGAVLGMVENYLGEETFRKGVHAYLAAHEYGNATAEDFWNAQTAVSHKPVDKIMESLVAEPGAPILEFGDPAAGQVPVAQSRFFLSPGITPDPGQKWTVPVCFKADGKKQDCEVLTPSSSSLAVPPAKVLFANGGGKGYYRSAYAPDQYAALVGEVETGLTPEERISLTGDEWAQVRADKATVGDYLNLVAALRSDTSSDVLSGAVDNVSAIRDSVASTRDEREALAAWIRRTFGPVYAQLGNASASDTPHQREARAYLFSILAGYGNDANLRAQARDIANQYLADPSSVSPSLGQTALTIAAEDGDAALFDKLQKIYETSSDPVLQNTALRELVMFTNPELLERGFEYSVSPKVRNQDSLYQFNIAMRLPQNRDAAWKFIKTHWNQVQAEFTTTMGSYLVDGTGNFCSAEARDDVKNFFATHSVPAADSALRHALEHIDGCIELRRLQGPNLKQWLAAQRQ
jgi:aminopeptidase N/puromycin-sensitive aminopeptidase